ncbi:ABC transporter substrate-binding protein [Rhodospirillaceae bacterium]|jgi:glycine betaine/proline transport system substrate-binding protein|nr:ABC transporter substrate-binding protein [Rhodospirillaceae bacterium]
MMIGKSLLAIMFNVHKFVLMLKEEFELMRKLFIGLAVASSALLGLSTSAFSGAHAKCGDVTMAEMNWASAELMANIDKVILEEGYGCKVELVAGATMPSFTSMNEKGQPDVAAELWINAVRNPLNKAMKEGRLHSVVEGPITELGEGWWIPPHTRKKHPELKTVLDILKRPDLFPHSEDKSKGAFVGCPAGWGCQLANNNLFRAFEMEKKGWVLVDPGSAAGLDGSMSKAAERGENWFGYYWAPTALIGKYNMVPLDFGVPFAGKENWDGCIAKAEQDCANPKPSAWTKSEVHTVITDRFKKEGGAAVTYLTKRIVPGPVMNAMLVFMADQQAGGADAAVEFLKKHEAIWSKWVSSDAAKKIKKAL